MPLHDWSRVDPGIFHDFHGSWITQLSACLNEKLLPADFYALVELRSAGFRLGDPSTLQLSDSTESFPPPAAVSGAVRLEEPKARPAGESDLPHYARKQNRIVIRRAAGDEVVAVLEILSPPNKCSRHTIRGLADDVTELVMRRIHTLILDLLPPASSDPDGIHGAIWESVAGQEYRLPSRWVRTFASYDANGGIRAFVEHTVVGKPLPEMPLFLGLRMHVEVPLERRYQAAFEALPRRWQNVLNQ